MRLLFLIAALLFTFVPQMAPAQDVPVTLPVILSLSGPAAATGATEQQALQIYEKLVNSTGGIRGRSLHFAIYDDQSSPQISLQLTNTILASHPPVILGSILTATCASMATVLIKNGPVHFCFSPGVTTEPNGYVFASSSTFPANSLADLNFVKRRKYTRIAFIAATDASGQESERLMRANVQLPEYRSISLVGGENFAPSDISVTAQIARIKSGDPQLLFVFAIGSALSTVLRTVHDAGLDVPVLTNAVNMNVPQLRQYAAYLPKELLFLGFPYQGTAFPNAAIKKASTEFVDAYKAVGITSPSPMAVYAWDPAKLVVFALRQLGPDVTAAQLRDFLANLHGVAGLNGTYDFRIGDQHGLGKGASQMTIVRWDPGKLTWDTAP